MKLFFETVGQSRSFLMSIPFGLLAAVLLDYRKRGGVWRNLFDILILLVLGSALFILLVILREQSLRIYHLLGILCGACLYLLGIARIKSWIISRKTPIDEE